MTLIDKIHNDKIIEDDKGKKTIVLPNGKEVIDSRNFAFDRDPLVVRRAIMLTLQYKFLEDILRVNEKREKVNIKCL